MFTLKFEELEPQDLRLLNESIEKSINEKSKEILSYNKIIFDESTTEEIKRISEIKCNSIRKDCSRLQKIKNKIDQKIKTYCI